jgi:hypothetical protein
MIVLLLLVTGILLLGLSYWVQRWIVRLPLLPLATLFLAAGTYFGWYLYRPVPAETEEDWFQGMRYKRLVHQDPRPLIIHLVTVRLDTPGVSLFVTPPESAGEHPLRGQTTSAFLQRHHLQVAINGSFFYPWHAHSPFDYYPHVGDPVSVHGLAISNGKVYSPAEPEHHTLFFTRDGRAMIGTECDGAVQAISGSDLLVRDGAIALDAQTAAFQRTHEPRTAVALSKDARQLLLFVIDGRQPNYSEGVTLTELAEIIRANGGWTALHLDGGGSSTLVMQGPDGSPMVVNSPVHGRHPPGRERPVANHLGIFTKRP